MSNDIDLAGGNGPIENGYNSLEGDDVQDMNDSGIFCANPLENVPLMLAADDDNTSDHEVDQCRYIQSNLI